MSFNRSGPGFVHSGGSVTQAALEAAITDREGFKDSVNLDQVVDVRDYLTGTSGTPGDANDDSTAIQAAAAVARSTGRTLFFAPGNWKLTSKVALDWRTVRISGYGATVTLDPTATIGFEIGLNGGPTQQVLIEGLEILGDGHDSGQTLINCIDLSPKMITLRSMRLFYGGVGLHTRYTDYMVMEKVHFKGSATNWIGDSRTNVTTLTACAFSGQDAGGTSVTDYHIHAKDIDGCSVTASEFGDGDIGLFLDTAAGGYNTNISFRNCRTERCHDVVAQLGTATGANIPSGVVFEECTFMGDTDTDQRADFIRTNRCAGVVLRNCVMNNFNPAVSMTSGATTNGDATVTVASTAGLFPGATLVGTGIPTDTQVLSVTNGTTFEMTANASATNTGLTITTRASALVKSQSAVGTQIELQDCVVSAGGVLLREHNNVERSGKRIVYGGDGTSLVPMPLGLTYRIPGSISVGATYNLGVVPRNLRVTFINHSVGVGIASDASNYWTLDVRRYSAGADQGSTGSINSLSSRFASAYRFNQVSSLGAQVSLSAYDVFVLVATPTGSPPALQDLSILISYEPAS